MLNRHGFACHFVEHILIRRLHSEPRIEAFDARFGGSSTIARFASARLPLGSI